MLQQLVLYFRWEEGGREDTTVKWSFLEHKGPIFAPPYERLPKDVKFIYDGKPMRLSRDAEEVAGFFGRMIDHDSLEAEALATAINFLRILPPIILLPFLSKTTSKEEAEAGVVAQGATQPLLHHSPQVFPFLTRCVNGSFWTREPR